MFPVDGRFLSNFSPNKTNDQLFTNGNLILKKQEKSIDTVQQKYR